MYQYLFILRTPVKAVMLSLRFCKNANHDNVDRASISHTCLGRGVNVVVDVKKVRLVYCTAIISFC